MSEPELVALSEPRHACTGCGGSCRGVRVRLFDDEVERIRSLAPSLGVDEPVVDGVLRQVDGECAFLDGDRCRIHAAHGPDAKPWICQQFPLVVVLVDGKARTGIDPGCYSASDDAPPAEIAFRGAHEVNHPPDWAAQEQALIGLSLRPGQTVAGMLEALCPGAPDAVGLPVGLADRWGSVLRKPELVALLRSPETGFSVRANLLPVFRALAATDGLPPLALDPAFDAWAVEVARRMLFLRLAPRTPPSATALLVLLGAVVIAASGVPEPTRALSAWARVLRAPPFVHALIPGPEALALLATGQRGGP